MPTSDSTVAQMPLLVSSRPTVGADDLGARRREVAEVGLACSASSTCCAVVLSDAPDFGADLRHADHHLLLRRIAVRLDDGVLSAARIVAIERRAHLLRSDVGCRTARSPTVPPANSTPRGMPLVADRRRRRRG